MTGTGAPRGRPKKRGKISNFRLIRASASEVGARDLADGTRDDVDVARSGAGRVRLRGVDESPIVLCAMDHGSPDMVPGLVKTGLATWAWCWLPAPWPPVLAASYAATYFLNTNRSMDISMDVSINLSMYMFGIGSGFGVRMFCVSWIMVPLLFCQG